MSELKENFWNPYVVGSAKYHKLLGLGSVVLVLAVWTMASVFGWVAPNKLPSPLSIFEALSYLAWDTDNQRSLLLNATLYSVGRILAASFLVILVGLPIGFLMGASPKINSILSPLVDPFRSAPMVALLPIMVMWFGIEEKMKVLFLFIGSVVYLIPMVRDAIRAVPQSYWISARDLGGTPFESTYRAVLPMAMPRIMDAIIVSVSVMWTYITIAEYVNAKQGLGQMIQNSLRFSAMDQVFAGIIVIIALALLTYHLMNWAKRKMYPWETK